MKYLAYDVGGTFIKYACMNENGEMLHQGKVPTPRDTQSHFIQVLKDIFVKESDIQGVALSLPGTIDTQKGMVLQGGSLQYNNRCSMKELLEKELGVPVELENDARCACLAEMWKGNLKDVQNGAVLTFGTGIGGAFVLNGELYKGSHFISGEVSMLLTKDFADHGIHGVWGSEGSVPKLIKQICEAKKAELRSGEDVFQWIKEGDETACAILDAYCTRMSYPLFNLQLILDPACICIGGGVSENPLFVEGIQKAMKRFYEQLPIKMPQLKILSCAFHNDSNLLGALYHYQMMRGETK